MKQPIIGLTPAFDGENSRSYLSTSYIAAIQNAGGIPVTLPLMGTEEQYEQLAALCDGFLFTGGPDAAPGMFGEDTWFKCGAVSPIRDDMEARLFKIAYKSGKPIIGICRGIQIINICLGGTIYQDIMTQYHRENGEMPLKHRQTEAGIYPTHKDYAAPGSFFEETFGSEFAVNTFHHQAVKDVAPGCVAEVTSEDGLIEGISDPRYGFLHATQWHPEMMFPQCEGARKFFKAFVDACRK